MSEEKYKSILKETICAFKAKNVKIYKETKNEFFKSSYADLSTILDAIEVEAAACGLVIFSKIKLEGTDRFLETTYIDHKDPKSNKLSHYIWQRYASSVWDDIRIDNILPFRDSKEEDDEKHVHPLQLDVIDRLVDLYTNKGEVVLTPFMGVGSEVYSPVSMGRKAIGIELKESYYKQATINLSLAANRFEEANQQQDLFAIASGE